ncbi:MAG: ATP phosphoribosyltransferase regulatory subunit [Xylophilus ampelinus]
MSAWVLPDHIADVLPSEARHLEELRRGLLDTAQTYGYELVIPPLLEHLDSLLTGAGKTLDLQTFKLVDQMSGRMLGLRADTTQQAARIDAHLLNRSGVTRLCYCGPVVHVRPDQPLSTREPLQFGAEIYGCSSIQGDIEALTLALDCLRTAQIRDMHVDLCDGRVARAILDRADAEASMAERIYAALAAKDRAMLSVLSESFPADSRRALLELVGLYGDASVLDRAARAFASFGELGHVFEELRLLLSRVDGASVGFDFADVGGYSYYSGVRFAIYVQSSGAAVARGGRYDEVGSVFGRNRPAVGFSLDLRRLVGLAQHPPLRPAILAPWHVEGHEAAASAESDLATVVRALRASGETVIFTSDIGQAHESGEFVCDRSLVLRGCRWVTENLQNQ